MSYPSTVVCLTFLWLLWTVLPLAGQPPVTQKKSQFIAYDAVNDTLGYQIEIHHLL